MQGANQHLQAGLVNITKLQQLDLEWNPEACSGDLRVTGRMVQKVSEVFGDYSTVLSNRGFISGVHLWLIKVNNLSEPDSIFIGVCRGCMPLDQDPQVSVMLHSCQGFDMLQTPCMAGCTSIGSRRCHRALEHALPVS